MIFRQLFEPVSCTYSYLIASRRGGEALIVDPVLEKVDRYLQLMRDLDVHLVKAVDTGGVLHELAAATGKRLLFYCAFGERSAMAVQAAQDAGLPTACHIEGGMGAWTKLHGHQVDPTERATTANNRT
jgi:rhodanese-related sulfurtransferase